MKYSILPLSRNDVGGSTSGIRKRACTPPYNFARKEFIPYISLLYFKERAREKPASVEREREAGVCKVAHMLLWMGEGKSD